MNSYPNASSPARSLKVGEKRRNGKSVAKTDILSIGIGALVMAAAASILILVIGKEANLSTNQILASGAAIAVGASALLTLIINRRTEVVAAKTAGASPVWPDVSLDRVLMGLVRASELRDTELAGHCERVAENSVLVGEALGLEAGALHELYWGGLLHDLGKLAVADRTLKKASRLSQDELVEIRQHPSFGADLLNELGPELNGIAATVLYHHERWDGYGYPDGLKGEEIPLSARIVAVSDVFEALTSARPYRQPLRADQALVYLRRSVGTHFDPAVVSTFENLFNSGHLHVSTDASLEGPEISDQISWRFGLSRAG